MVQNQHTYSEGFTQEQKYAQQMVTINNHPWIDTTCSLQIYLMVTEESKDKAKGTMDESSKFTDL